MISMRESSMFTCQRRAISDKRSLLIVTIILCGWNMLRLHTFCNPIARNTYEYIDFYFVFEIFSFQKEKAAEYVPERSFLLNICKEAYEKANLCTDNDDNKEDWTHLYMMAKIEEKLHRNKLLDALKKYASVR